MGGSVGGGKNNHALFTGSTVAGGWSNYADGEYTTVSGGQGDSASGTHSSIGGGQDNKAFGDWSAVSGGEQNWAIGHYSAVGGGSLNSARGDKSVIGGGVGNAVKSKGGWSTIAGGSFNVTSAEGATIGGGAASSASGFASTVSGGYSNRASGSYSSVPGGLDCIAAGDYSFAAGRDAEANHDGSFVWADTTDASFVSTAANQFRVRASGGTQFFSHAFLSTGVTLASGGGAWASVSDSTVKENIRPVDGQDILEKLAKLDITRWNYETQDESIEHIGPMAQDFYRLFGLGEDDKHINTLDPDGISLSAIKALYARNEAQQRQIEELTREVDALSAIKAELAQIKVLVNQLVEKSKGDANSQYGMK